MRQTLPLYHCSCDKDYLAIRARGCLRIRFAKSIGLEACAIRMARRAPLSKFDA